MKDILVCGDQNHYGAAEIGAMIREARAVRPRASRGVVLRIVLGAMKDKPRSAGG